MPTDTFFSYCRDDASFALRLAGDLKAAGANVWLDQLDIVAGDRWDRAVENALTSCTRMLVVLSPQSVASPNVMDEVSFALEENKIVIPILYQECAVPFRLRRVHYVDFRADYDKSLQELLRTLGHRDAGAATPAAARPVQVAPAPAKAAAVTPARVTPAPVRPVVETAARSKAAPSREPVAAASVSQPGTASHLPHVVSAALTMLVTGLGFQLPGLTAGGIAIEFGLASTALASALGARTVGVLLGCLIGGVLGDRIGRGRLLQISLGLFGLVALVAAIASSLSLIFAIALLAGLAFGAAVPNAVSLAWESASRGRQVLAVTLTFGSASLTGALGSVLIGSMGGGAVWRPIFVAHGVVSLVVAAVNFSLLRESSSRQQQLPRVSPWAVFSPEQVRGTLALSLGFFCILLAIASQSFWIAWGIDRASLTIGLGIGGVGGFVVAILGALGAVRIGNRTVVLSLAVASLLASILAQAAGPAVWSLVLLATLMQAVNILLYALAARAYPIGSRATGIGVVAGLGRTAALALPYIPSGTVLLFGTSIALVLVCVALFLTRRDSESNALKAEAAFT